MDSLRVHQFKITSYLLWSKAHMWMITCFTWVYVAERTRQDPELICIMYLKCTDLHAFFIIFLCFPIQFLEPDFELTF